MTEADWALIEDVVIPDASTEPAEYVRALIEVLGDRDPVDVLSRTPGEVDRILGSEQPGVVLAREGPGEWSFRDVLGHLLDVDLVYGFRLRLALTEQVPSYPGYDEKRFSQLPKLDVVGLAAAFRWLRLANLELIGRLTPEQLARQGVHGEQGLEDVGLMVKKLAGHDLAHLGQMRRAIRNVRDGDGADREAAERLLRHAERVFAAQDIDAICALFTEDVLARYAGEPEISGQQQLRDYLERRLRRQLGYRPVKTLVAVVGNLVVDSWEGSWTDADSGVRMAGRGIELLKLRDGLVAELDAVFKAWPV
jgi:nuclear transport factor 2 (NTF2) superfamily protein